MSWTKIDDQLHGHRKILRAWKCRPALGLHFMAMSYAASHEPQGFIPEEWVEEKLPAARERERAVAALTDVPAGFKAGLWEPVDGGWNIHDWDEYNGSAKTREEVRAAKSEAGKKGAAARWGDGRRDDTAMAACHDAANDTAIAPSPNPSATPKPPRPTITDRAVELGFSEWLDDLHTVTGKTVPGVGTKTRKTLAERYVACCGELAEADQADPLPAMKLATRAAHADPHRAENGYDGPENVLRVTKILGLVDNGRRLSNGRRDRPASVAEIHAAQQRRSAA